MPTTPKTTPKKRQSLSMQIYAAMLGDAPEVERAAPITRPRLKMRVRLEAKLEHVGVSPFCRMTLRDHVERCAAYAVKAVDEARERLAASKPKPLDARRDRAEPAPLKSIVLIGPAARRGRREAAPLTSRAA